MPLPFISISTRNFDAMAKFFSDLGFEVTDGDGTQLCPLFNNGQGAYVKRNDFEFNLEECTFGEPTGAFNLLILDFTTDEIERTKHSGYSYTETNSLYGCWRQVISPDGGIVSF